MLDDSTHIRELPLFVARQALGRELGVGHEHLLQPHLFRRAHEGHDLAASEVAGGENHVVLADAFQASARSLNQIAGCVDHRQRRRRNPFGCQFALNLCPKRQLDIAAVEPSGGLVFRIDSRHPDDLAAGATGQLDGHGVQSADAVIQRHGAVRLDARHGFRHDLRSFAGLNVVGFQHEAAHPVCEKFLRAVDVVDPAGDHVGPHVDLQIVGPFQRLPRAIGYVDGFLGRCFWRHGVLGRSVLIGNP